MWNVDSNVSTILTNLNLGCYKINISRSDRVCSEIPEWFNIREPMKVNQHMSRCLWLQIRKKPTKKSHVLFHKKRSLEVTWFQGSFWSTTMLSRSQVPLIFSLCNGRCVGDSLHSCKMVVDMLNILKKKKKKAMTLPCPFASPPSRIHFMCHWPWSCHSSMFNQPLREIIELL